MSEQIRSGEGWTASNVTSVMARMGLEPELLDPMPGNDLRMIAAADPVTGMRFGAVFMAAEKGRVSNLGFVSVLPAPRLSPEGAEAINAQLPMALAFLEEGDLWIYAELDTTGRFAEDFFKVQTNFYLTDMRTALQLLAGSGEMNFMAMNAFRALRNQGAQGEEVFMRLSNRDPEAERPSRRPVQSFAAEACPKCKGSGRKMFRDCSACGGSGETLA